MYLSQGGLSFKKPGEKTHDIGCTCQSCNGKGRHAHEDDYEVFIILQGKGIIKINGVNHALVAGDVVVCDPGEDHHLIADENDPCVNLWLHTSNIRHQD